MAYAADMPWDISGGAAREGSRHSLRHLRLLYRWSSWSSWLLKKYRDQINKIYDCMCLATNFDRSGTQSGDLMTFLDRNRALYLDVALTAETSLRPAAEIVCYSWKRMGP